MSVDKGRRRWGLALLALGLALLGPNRSSAQSATDVMAGLRAGGGWVSIPIVDGRGSMRTSMLPALGLRVEGCAQVRPGHSGSFEIRAHEAVGDTTLVLAAEPGEALPFAHTFGRQAQIDLVVSWSEPRDTTLMMWVGLAVGRTVEEACQPRYGS